MPANRVWRAFRFRAVLLSAKTVAANCDMVYTPAHKDRDMAASTTMTIRVTPDLKVKLGRLAHTTRRTRSWLAAEAVEAYVDNEL